MRDVGRRVAETREIRALTQAQLAEKADVSLKYLQRIESGGCNLTIRSLVKIANVLLIPVDALFFPPTSRGTVKLGRPRSRRTPAS